MKRLRGLAALMMVCIMGLSLCACGGDKGKKEESPLPEEEAEEQLPDTEGETIYIYSYDGAFEEQLQYFYELYPEYQSRVEFVNLELGAASKEYQSTIRELLKKGVDGEEKQEDTEDGDEVEFVEEPKYPSIVVNDSIMGYTFIQNDYSVPVSMLGITQEDMQDMYPYTLNAAMFQGEVKGLAWRVMPGAFLYRTDIAGEVLGDSSPEAVQEMLSTWNGFLETAKKMKEAGYKMLSGSDELVYAKLQDKKQPWIDEERLLIDSNVKDCLELSKRLQKEEYAGDILITSRERDTSFGSDVFGWFVFPDTVYGEIDAGNHDGEFQLCQGPNAYQWGSTYLTVSPECPDMELAAFIVRTLCCNEEVLERMAGENFVNNRVVMEKITGKAEGLSQLGGQNPLEVWLAVEDGINAKAVTSYDARFDSWVYELSTSYSAGRIETLDEVYDRFKDKVSDAFNYIKIE